MRMLQVRRVGGSIPTSSLRRAETWPRPAELDAWPVRVVDAWPVRVIDAWPVRVIDAWPVRVIDAWPVRRCAELVLPDVSTPDGMEIMS